MDKQTRGHSISAQAQQCMVMKVKWKTEHSVKYEAKVTEP